MIFLFFGIGYAFIILKLKESAAVICQVENENKNSFWLRSMF